MDCQLCVLRKILVKSTNNYDYYFIKWPRRGSQLKAVTVAVSQSVATVHAEVRVIIFLLRHGIAGAKPLSMYPFIFI